MLGVLGDELSELSGKFVLQATWKTSDFRGLERAKVGLCLLSTLSKKDFSLSHQAGLSAPLENSLSLHVCFPWL